MQEHIITTWNALRGSSIGRWIFSKLIGYFVPYSGSISPMVKKIEPGSSTVIIKEKRRIQNHLQSVHAIALANIGELASGLAMIAALPKKTKAIVTKLEIEYIKKARGTLSAQGEAHPPSTITSPIETLATADIYDENNDKVSTVLVTWRIAPL